MTQFINLIAHAGEEHSDTVESISHFVPEWYFVLPLFLITVALIGYLIWLVSGKKLGVVMMVLAVLLLICGFTMYVISPIISVASITIGIILAGILAFSGLSD